MRVLWAVFLFLYVCQFQDVYSVNDPDFERPHRGCYYTNWAQYRKGRGKFTVADINPSLCTYIVVAFGKIENTTLTTLEWNDEDSFRELVGLKETHPRLKILLSVGGWTLSHQLVAVSSVQESRRSFAASTVSNLRYWELDGLDVDWEYPDAALKAQYSALLLDLRTAFEDEARDTGRTRLALAAAVHFTSDGGYDGRVLNQTLDFVNLMTYDLHGAWKKDMVGHHAPLFKGPFGQHSKESVSAIVKSWEHIGIKKNKLVIGLPMYGRGWQLSDWTNHSLGAPAKGAINSSNFTGEAGAWPFYEICQRFQKGNATLVFDDNIQAEYAFTKDLWIGYDNRATVLAKTRWAKANDLGGVYIWDLAQDDFLNDCGLGPFPLLSAIYEVLVGAKPWRAPTTARSTVTSTKATTLATTFSSTRSATPSKSPTSMPTSLARVIFPVNGLVTGKPTQPKASLGKNVCDKIFCVWNGAGSFAVGKCEVKYCDCDAGSNPYDRECIGGLLYDPVSKYCNWRENVDGCSRLRSL